MFSGLTSRWTTPCAWEIDGGAGAFADATGRIVSNFLVSAAGELTDHELGVVFVQGPGSPEANGRRSEP